MAFLKSAKTLTSEGIEQLKKKDFEKALKSFQRAAKKKPRDVNILNYLSQALTALGRIDDALHTIGKAIEYEPSNIIHWQLKATYLMMKERYEEAVPVIEKCMELRPSDVNFLMRGQVDYILKQYESAGEWFDRALKIDPENPLSNHMKGLVLYNLGLYSEAIPHLEKVIVVGGAEAVQSILDDCKSRTEKE